MDNIVLNIGKNLSRMELVSQLNAIMICREGPCYFILSPDNFQKVYDGNFDLIYAGGELGNFFKGNGLYIKVDYGFNNNDEIICLETMQDIKVYLRSKKIQKIKSANPN